jgi:hypothetical protein
MPNTTVDFDPLLRRLGTPLRAVYYPLGFPLEIETNDPRVLTHADASFGIFRQRSPQDPPLRLRVLCDPAATAGPPWPAHSYRASRDLFTVVSGPENFLVCDLQSREATGFFSPALLEDRDHFCTDFMESFVYMTIQRHWATPVHAACVVRDGVAICLAGDSNAGKSTLAYDCAKSGYELLSDNSVWLLNATEKRTLLGNPSRLRLRLPARDFFPELRALPVSTQANGDEYLAVPAQEMLAGHIVVEAQPGPFVFLDRRTTPAAPALEPVPLEEAHARLFRDRNPAIDEPHVLRETERVIGESIRAGAYSMRYTTLEQALACLEEIPLSKTSNSPNSLKRNIA